MTTRLLGISMAQVLLTAVGMVWAQPAEPEREGHPGLPPMTAQEVTPLLVRPIAALRPALLSDHHVEVNYELELASPLAVSLEKVEVLDPRHDDAVLAALEGSQLLARLRLYGQAAPSLALAAGISGYLRVDLTFARLEDVPLVVDHRFTLTATVPPATQPAELVQRLVRVGVELERPPVIGPPVAGDRWVAGLVGGERAHRKTIMPVGGRWVVPERWAVDWIRLDPSNRLATGDGSHNEDYPQFHQPLLAVADGRVVSARDGMPDIPPGPLPAGMTLDAASGNFVVLDIGHGYCALYAHISPGTLRVQEGQWVHRGQVLGLLGNSGNTTGPHLHFQINDGCVALSSDGVPYLIDSFRLDGTVVSSDDLDAESQHPELPVPVAATSGHVTHRMEMPADLAFVTFPDQRWH